MEALVFDIQSDGDFYCKPLFTTVVQEDSRLFESYLINNLNEIEKTFKTTRPYVQCIADTISDFVVAYYDGQQSYYNKNNDGIWFVRQDGEFQWSFDLENGNQHIRVYLQDMSVSQVQGGFLINTF